MKRKELNKPYCTNYKYNLSFVTRAVTKISSGKVYALGEDLDGYEGQGGHAHSRRVNPRGRTTTSTRFSNTK